jgi:formate hydrogenlyase subunit 3/multisubunit Na+/H+ antiporter MnhD subunit
MGVVAAVLGMGLAAGDAGSGLTAAYYASHHVLVKGALFLAVGVIAAGGAGVRAWVLVPALLLSLSLGGLPPTGGALAKYAVKEQLDVGVVALLSALSAIGTTVLMLHFVRRLAAFGSRDATQRAGAGLTLPWLAAALAALLVPWWLYPSLDAGPVTATLTYAAVGAAVWPVLAGAALAALLSRHGERLPRIPAGDLVVLAERAAPALRGLGQAVAGFDAIVARWPVATAAAIAVAIGFGALLTR